MLALTLLALLAHAPAMSARIRSSGDSIEIEGELVRGDKEKFSKLMRPDITRVTVDSPGGVISEGIAIARQMRLGGLHVEVVGPCVSACASALFVAGRTRTIRPGGFVAFHGGDVGLARNFVQRLLHTRDDSGRYSAAIARIGEELRAQYALQHAALLALQADRPTQFDWLDYVYDFTSQSVGGVALAESSGRLTPSTLGPPICQFWVPDEAGLREIGLTSEFRWTADRDQIARRLRAESGRIYWGGLLELKARPEAPCPG